MKAPSAEPRGLVVILAVPPFSPLFRLRSMMCTEALGVFWSRPPVYEAGLVVCGFCGGPHGVRVGHPRETGVITQRNRLRV